MVGVAATRVEHEASDNELAHERTDLSMNRTYLSFERTLMSWIRTSLSMISFGFTIGKLGDLMDRVEVKGLLRVHTFSIRGLAVFLVVLGTLALGVACVQFQRRMKTLYAMGLPKQHSLSLFIAMVLAVMGALALTALILAV